MKQLIISKTAYQSIAHYILKSPLSVAEIADRLSVSLTEMYALLTGTTAFQLEQLIELSFHIDINLSEVVETHNTALNATINFFDRAIKHDRSMQNAYDKQMINERMTSLINFIDDEFGRIAI